MAAARMGTSLACAWSATLWTRDEDGGGTMVTAAFRINRNGGAAAGSFAKRFRSTSFTTYWEVRHVTRVNSASWSRMWLAPVVEAAPAMRTSASQKMRTCRAASKIRFTGASEHCHASFGEGEPSLGGLRLQGPLLVAIVRFQQLAWERLGFSARAGLSHRGQAPSGCPQRRGSTLREVSPGASTSRVDESALWSVA